MLLDNKNENKKVHEWIAQYTETGYLDIVTGYFTVGALAFLSDKTNERILQYRLVLGEIVNFDDKIPSLNLLNESISADVALKVCTLAKQAVAFLEQRKVEVKTLEPNFCHAKLFLKNAHTDDRNNYFVSGSSNLTEAGLGQKATSNLELNIAETGNNGQYRELAQWFGTLWNIPQAHSQKTLRDENGKSFKKDFKQYLIDEISCLFKIYTPEQIYFKILYELFYKNADNPDADKQMTRLADTVIYKHLYDFQKVGVRSLLQMLNKYNGAVLADAVGLGKTWSALAVMKALQSDHKVILLCPKKLEQNWRQYLAGTNSLFESDKLDYTIRFHTDLREGGLQSKDLNANYFTDDKKKLIVIDESHNLRNDASSRYQFLVSELLQKSSGECKVLLLSATPINNSFKDVRNQFKLLCGGRNDGFGETLGINNIEWAFRDIQTHFNEWAKEPSATLTDFHARIKDSNFFSLTDNLLVARTRDSIKTTYDNTLRFPAHTLPQNIFLTPMNFGDVESFAELLENMQLKLSAYQPSSYTLTKEERAIREAEKNERKEKGTKAEKDAVLGDNVQREFFLVKMMMILMMKRLESSWHSFYSTVDRIHTHHKSTLDKISAFQENKKADSALDSIDENLAEDDDNKEFEQFLIGKSKKNPISLRTIDEAGNLEEFKKDIKEDRKLLKYILDNLIEFQQKIVKESALTSNDTKLQKLMEIIATKQKSDNKKLVIFTAYTDTATYLYDQLQKRGFTRFARVTGSENVVWNQTQPSKNMQQVLQRFAPYTKLYKEMNWPLFHPTSDETAYSEWKRWLAENEPASSALLANEIDILIATDVLSEGQNLQDADMVVNYDIHWNPVRVIQRVGRIDRIGSPNDTIQCVNFWPAKDIDDYINLKERVERRMAIMKLAGSEVIDQFTDDFNTIAHSQHLDDQQNATMLRQMQASLDEIEGEHSIGFSDFSFDNYRQALNNMMAQKAAEFAQLPNAIFSGVRPDAVQQCQSGMIALLGYPAQKRYSPTHRYLSHELVYIDPQGKAITSNRKEVLQLLSAIFHLPRYVDDAIDKGDETAIQALVSALKNYLDTQASDTKVLEDGTTRKTMGTEAIDILAKLRKGDKGALSRVKQNVTVDEKYQLDKFDLITWLIVS